MPNVKFYIDGRHHPAAGDVIAAMLPDLRRMLCESLGVAREVCQFAVIETAGLDDQPAVNAELQLLTGPARTHEHLLGLARQLREELARATELTVAVRMSSIEPRSYVVLK
jgi:hypothetical protein